MNHLTEKELSELRAELERQLAKLERSMALTDEASKPVQLDQTTVGRLSRMDSLQSQGMAKSLSERESLRLALIREAIQRLDTGDYGVCAACGAEVAFQRLVVFPESTTCTSCAG